MRDLPQNQGGDQKSCESLTSTMVRLEMFPPFLKFSSIVLVTLIVISGVGTSLAQNEVSESSETSTKVFEVELQLSPSLEARRVVFESILVRAQKRLLTVAKKYEWDHLMEEPLMRQVKIFDSKPAYDQFLREVFPEAKEMKIPRSFTAGFQDDTFFAVSPELYAECVPKFVEPDFYEKLITHELAHKLHARIVNGNEEMMGPIWIWEGFATFAAGQFEGRTRPLSQEQIESIITSENRGDYRDYNALVKHFVKLVPLPELIRRSYKSDFADWLLENANPKPASAPN